MPANASPLTVRQITTNGDTTRWRNGRELATAINSVQYRGDVLNELADEQHAYVATA